MKNRKKTGLWLAFGVAMGASIGSATDNTGHWISLGIAMGAAIGTAKMKSMTRMITSPVPPDPNDQGLARPEPAKWIFDGNLL